MRTVLYWGQHWLMTVLYWKIYCTEGCTVLRTVLCRRQYCTEGCTVLKTVLKNVLWCGQYFNEDSTVLRTVLSSGFWLIWLGQLPNLYLINLWYYMALYIIQIIPVGSTIIIRDLWLKLENDLIKSRYQSRMTSVVLYFWRPCIRIVNRHSSIVRHSLCMCIIISFLCITDFVNKCNITDMNLSWLSSLSQKKQVCM